MEVNSWFNQLLYLLLTQRKNNWLRTKLQRLLWHKTLQESLECLMTFLWVLANSTWFLLKVYPSIKRMGQQTGKLTQPNLLVQGKVQGYLQSIQCTIIYITMAIKKDLKFSPTSSSTVLKIQTWIVRGFNWKIKRRNWESSSRAWAKIFWLGIPPGATFIKEGKKQKQ